MRTRILPIVIAALLSGVVLARNAQAPPVADNGTPLLRATLDLQLARARILDARWSEVPAALRQAATDLDAYVALSPGPHDIEAGYIRQQLMESAANPATDPATLLDRIDYLWGPPLNRWYRAVTK